MRNLRPPDGIVGKPGNARINQPPALEVIFTALARLVSQFKHRTKAILRPALLCHFRTREIAFLTDCSMTLGNLEDIME